MREILFRGKHYKKGWLYGSLLQPINSKSTRINGTNHRCEVNPDTVGQYIGLTDKNGVKIFEGDIIKAVDIETGAEVIAYVVYWEVGMRFCSIALDNGKEIDFYTAPCDYTFEVIGNKWDNPELIEVDE